MCTWRHGEGVPRGQRLTHFTLGVAPLPRVSVHVHSRYHMDIICFGFKVSYRIYNSDSPCSLLWGFTSLPSTPNRAAYNIHTARALPLDLRG